MWEKMEQVLNKLTEHIHFPRLKYQIVVNEKIKKLKNELASHTETKINRKTRTLS